MRSSCRTFPFTPEIRSELPLDRDGDALGGLKPPENAPHKARRYAHLSGNLAEIWPDPKLLPESDYVRGRLEGQSGTSLTNESLFHNGIEIKEIIPLTTNTSVAPSIAQRVRVLRDSIGYSQKQLADALDVSQSNIAKWETGKLKPPGPACARLAKLAPMEERDYWLGLAGVEMAPVEKASGTRPIPLLRDAAACGTPRTLDEKEIEDVIQFPRKWLPRGGSIYAIHVVGDSMSPILEEGYVALVDTSRRDVKLLENSMVAARDGDGITLKWLRKQDRMYLLVPQHTSQRHPVMVWSSSDDKAIVGEVVKWIGEPHAIRKRK